MSTSAIQPHKSLKKAHVVLVKCWSYLFVDTFTSNIDCLLTRIFLEAVTAGGRSVAWLTVNLYLFKKLDFSTVMHSVVT